MNIKITKEHSDLLLKHTTDRILFGSEDGEDKDWLCVVKPNIHMDAALHNRDHFLFYKGEGVDYLFATPRCLINGLITGTSTLLYELLLEGKLKETNLSFIEDYAKKSLATQKLAKAFIGCAQRDLKQSKFLEGDKKTKKLKWVSIYYNIVVEMLNLYGYSVEDYTTLEVLRGMISKLPKYSENVDKLLDFLPSPTYNDDLYSVSHYYYKAWGESL